MLSLMILFAKSVNASDALSFDRHFVECCQASVAGFPIFNAFQAQRSCGLSIAIAMDEANSRMTELLDINNTFGEIGCEGRGAPGQPNRDFALTLPEQVCEREFSGLGSDTSDRHQQPWRRLDSGSAMVDASGGVIFLIQWPGGPAMHFFLHELATPTVQKLFSIHRSLYGVPKLLPPRLSFPTTRVQ
jgi:hypothetical protein